MNSAKLHNSRLEVGTLPISHVRLSEVTEVEYPQIIKFSASPIQDFIHVSSHRQILKFEYNVLGT